MYLVLHISSQTQDMWGVELMFFKDTLLLYPIYTRQIKSYPFLFISISPFLSLPIPLHTLLLEPFIWLLSTHQIGLAADGGSRHTSANDIPLCMHHAPCDMAFPNTLYCLPLSDLLFVALTGSETLCIRIRGSLFM